MDEVIPRPTPESQKEFLERIEKERSNEVDDSVDEEFDID